LGVLVAVLQNLGNELCTHHDAARLARTRWVALPGAVPDIRCMMHLMASRSLSRNVY